MELKVIIAVKNIVFAVVLIVDRHFDSGQPMSKFGFGFDPFGFFGAVSIPSPIDVTSRKV